MFVGGSGVGFYLGDVGGGWLVCLLVMGFVCLLFMDCGFLRGSSFFDYYEVVLGFGYLLLLCVVDLFVLFVLFGFGVFCCLGIV